MRDSADTSSPGGFTRRENKQGPAASSHSQRSSDHQRPVRSDNAAQQPPAEGQSHRRAPRWQPGTQGAGQATGRSFQHHVDHIWGRPIANQLPTSTPSVAGGARPATCHAIQSMGGDHAPGRPTWHRHHAPARPRQERRGHRGGTNRAYVSYCQLTYRIRSVSARRAAGA